MRSINTIIPGTETYAPRDGKRIGNSDDWMFSLLLCRNLVVNKHQYRMVMECASLEFMSRGEYVYLLEHRSGQLHHPMTLERVIPREIRAMNKIRTETFLKTHCYPLTGYELRSGLYEHFFVPQEPREEQFDDDFYSNGKPVHLWIGRTKIYPHSMDKNKRLERLNAGLSWPLQEYDPILDDWKKRSSKAIFPPQCSTVRDRIPIMERYFGFDRTLPDKYDAICPLDGYIRTTSAEYRSPGWTWSAKCGRHYKMRICPRCLRVMRQKLYALS